VHLDLALVAEGVQGVDQAGCVGRLDLHDREVRQGELPPGLSEKHDHNRQSLRAAGARAAIWSGLVQIEEADPELQSGAGRGRAAIAPDRGFLKPAKGSPRLIEPLGVATADRLRLAEGGREIVGAGLALAVEEGAAEGLFHSLLDLLSHEPSFAKRITGSAHTGRDHTCCAYHCQPALARARAGEVILNPGDEVQGRIRVVFEKFQELSSAKAVTRYLRRRNLPLPAHPQQGSAPQEIVSPRRPVA